jgi:hypothetical protein
MDIAMAFVSLRPCVSVIRVITVPAVDGERSTSGMMEWLGYGQRKKMSDLRRARAFTMARWTTGRSSGAVVDQNEGGLLP